MTKPTYQPDEPNERGVRLCPVWKIKGGHPCDAHCGPDLTGYTQCKISHQIDPNGCICLPWLWDLIKSEKTAWRRVGYLGGKLDRFRELLDRLSVAIRKDGGHE